MPQRALRIRVFLGLSGSLALAFAFHALAFYPDPQATGFGDWQQIHHNWEVALASWRQHGEWALWNPHHCGGITHLGNPESQHFSPFFLLSFPLGTTLAIKLMLVAHAWAGMVGAFLFARRGLGLTRAGACVAAGGFALNGFFAWQMAGGHFTFVPFYLAPWLLLTWRAAYRELRWAVATAALLALTLLEGGTYPFPYFVLLLAFDAALVAARDVRRTRSARPLARVTATGLTIFGLTATLGAIRILPVVRTLRLFPRTIESTDSMLPHELIEVWTTWDFPWRHPDHIYVWNEYTAFVGWPLLVVALFGLGACLLRRRWEPALGLLFFAVLMMGNHGPFAPWELIHRLPVYDSLRVPSRFSVLATFYLALLAGAGLDAAAAWLRERRLLSRVGALPRQVLAALAVAVLVLPGTIFGVVIHDHWDLPAVHGAPAGRFHLDTSPAYQIELASLPRRGVGTTQCYVGAMSWRVAPGLWRGDRPQVRVPDGGRLLAAHRTNHGVFATVDLPERARVIFNQNFHPDWEVVGDTGSVVDDVGRLAVALPEGRHRLEVRYEPATLWYARILTLLGLLVAFLLWRGALPSR